MALKKNLALMGLTTAVRLVAGLLTFSLVARLLGPESFGVLMLWLSVATLLSLVTNYGLTTYVLREIGADPVLAESIINEGLTGKLLLTALVFACALVAAWGLGVEFKQVFLCLLLATVTDSFSEFLNAGFRARNRFDVETRLAAVTALTHAAIVVSAVLVYPSVEVAALAYAISRMVVLAITVPAVARHFATPKLAGLGPSISRLRMAFTYAADFGFQSLFGQIDSVVLNHYIGPVAVGLFQAGMRVFQGGTAAAQMLANVFLPRAARKANEAKGFAREGTRIQLSFLSVGAFFGLGMAMFPEKIVYGLFGSAFSALAKLLPLFGLLFFVRFAAAAWGILLTAAGEQQYRTIASVIHWGLVASVAPFLVSAFGITGWLISLILGNVLLGLLYAFKGARLVSSPWKTFGLILIGGLAFAPTLNYLT